MKKLLIILIGILMIPNAFAVTTYPRTKDNLRVRKEIAVNKNIDNILNTPSVNPSEKVYDFANVFNNEKIVSIKERVDAFRSKNEDVLTFSNIFDISKRQGGNIMQIIRQTTDVISEKIETKTEIETSLSGKKMEQKSRNRPG